VIAFSLALAYVASLAFGAYLLWRRDAYRTNVRDQLVSIGTRLAAMEHRRDAWNDAARFVEGERVKRGLTRGA
jgi:hypothetical protein